MRSGLALAAVAIALCLDGSPAVRPDTAATVDRSRHRKSHHEASDLVDFVPGGADDRAVDLVDFVPGGADDSAEAGSVGARRFDQGWDHSLATAFADYLIFAVCIVLRLMMYWEREKTTDQEARWMVTLYMVFAEVTAGCCLFGGISHQLINYSWNHGEPTRGATALGQSWGSANSGYLYSWAVSVVLSPLGLGAGLLLVSACTRDRGLSSYATYAVVSAIALLAVAYEVKCLVAENFNGSGLAGGLLGIVFNFLGVLASLPYIQSHAGVRCLTLGFAANFAGYALAVFKPAACIDPARQDNECPFSPEFNHNATFHAMLAVGVVSQYWGALGAAQHAQKEAVEEA